MNRCLLVLLAFLLATGRLCALVSGSAPPGYAKRVYRIADGLPEGTVQAFAQTPDHFVWIGTTGGLVRFDGSHFTVFDRENTPAFKENSVFCLLTAQDGSLWIGTEGSGLIHYRGGEFETLGQKEGLTDSFVRAIGQDSGGRIWIGSNNGLFRTDFAHNWRQVERIDGKGGFPALAVNSIKEDTRGRLWLGGSRLFTLTAGVLREYNLAGDRARNRVKAVTETAGGAIWVGTVSGLYRLIPGEHVFLRMNQVHGTVRLLRQTSDGTLWVSVVGEGVIAYRIEGGIHLTRPFVLASDTVLSLFEDAEQNIWIGTETGMLRLSRTPVSFVSLPGSLDSDFGSIYQDREHDLWAASTHLFHLRDGVPRIYQVPGLAGLKVRNVFEAQDGSTWFGTDGSGLLHLRKGSIERYTTRGGLVNNFIRAILQARDGSMWIGTDEGVSHLTRTGFSNFSMKDGLAYQSVRAMIEDHNGDIWIGTELGLSHLHKNVFVSDPAVRELQQDKVWALHEDNNGTLWLGTRNDGLYRYRPGQLTHYTAAQGLANHSIYDILEDYAGHFWMSGPTGISMLDRHELDRFADHRTGRLSLTFYSIAAEDENVQIFGGMQPAGAMTPNGDVWFPSNRGLIHISRGQMPPQNLPPVLISKVVADGRQLPPVSAITLASGNSRLEISYVAVMMRSQEALRFKYKLEGLDKNWNQAGARHLADYTNVPAGKYTFRVGAFQLSKPGAVSEATLTVIKPQHFYRTWWFIAVCLLGVAAIIFAVYRLRMTQLRRRFQAVLAERSRLAREMHDTLLQGCASVSAALEAVSSLDSEQILLKHTLVESAREQMRITINEAREAVWQLRHERENPQDLADLMCGMGKRMSRELGVVIDCRVQGNGYVVDRPLAHELMMIAREAVHNAANHAAPSLVRLSVNFRADDLALEVQDDGCGFDPAVLSSENMHFGILGMQERVSRLGGTFQLKTGKASGTEIAVCVPRKMVVAPEEPDLFPI